MNENRPGCANWHILDGFRYLRISMSKQTFNLFLQQISQLTHEFPQAKIVATGTRQIIVTIKRRELGIKN